MSMKKYFLSAHKKVILKWLSIANEDGRYGVNILVC